MFQEPPVEDAPAIESPRVTWHRRDLLIGVLMLVGGFVAAAGAAALVVRGRRGAEGDPNVAVVLALITLCVEVWAGATVLFLARRRGMSLRDLGFVRPRDWSLTVTAVVGAYSVMIAYLVIVSVIGKVTGVHIADPKNTVPEDIAKTLPVQAVLALALVLGAPFGEELFFRGLVYRAVEASWGPVLGVIASGVAFALVHFNPSVVVPFACIGMVFAVIYRRSGSLWTTIAAHAIFNGVSFAITVVGTGGGR